MITLAGYLIVVGIIVGGLGCWVIAVARDPLGYFPPNAAWPALIGLILLSAGIIARIAL